MFQQIEDVRELKLVLEVVLFVAPIPSLANDEMLVFSCLFESLAHGLKVGGIGSIS